jgi:hypothetical protein
VRLRCGVLHERLLQRDDVRGLRRAKQQCLRDGRRGMRDVQFGQPMRGRRLHGLLQRERLFERLLQRNRLREPADEH